MIRCVTLNRKPPSAGFFFLGFLLLFAPAALAQDYEREKRLNDETLATLVEGEPQWLSQKNGHRFLALLIDVKNPKGTVIVAHGRGWSPDVGVYAQLRLRLAEKG